MTNWTYKGQDFLSPTSEQFGFVYKITNETNNKFYIGQKCLWKQIVRKPLKGQTKKRRSTVESDWQEYFGSSEDLKADVARLGFDNFKREILYICDCKSVMNYVETFLQFKEQVLVRDDCYNNIINCRIKGNKNIQKISLDMVL